MATALARSSSERKDVHVDVYESARQFSEIGAGVALFLRPWRALKALGLENTLNELLPHVPQENKIGELSSLSDAIVNSRC